MMGSPASLALPPPLLCVFLALFVVEVVPSTVGTGAGRGSESAEPRRFGAARLDRDAAFGVPLVLGGSFEDVWRAVGYAHAEDRLYQTFLRLATANGRMAEFYGAGTNQANVLSDAATRRTMYSLEERLALVASLRPRTQLMHQHFAQGMLERVREVNADPVLLPFEFSAIGVEAVPEDLFEMPSVMQYVLFTMRRLCSGHNPTYQLQNADLLATLQDRLGEAEGWQAFNDVATELGAFPLLDTVLGDGDRAPKGPNGTVWRRRPQRKPPARLSEPQLRAARRALAEHELIEGQLRNLSAASFDGSWALVDATSAGSTWAQFGPQDPNTFPTTFYEVFIDSEEAGIFAHYWNEPGSPINQIYGIFGNVTAGRNRGFGYDNDLLIETPSDITLDRVEEIAVRDADAVEVELYRSNGGGFVTSVDREEGVVITRRMAHMFRELQGVNMLSALFDHATPSQSFDDWMRELFTPEVQSDVIHSHLEFAASTGQVAAVMNGLTSALPDEFDRRFPLVREQSGQELPEYSSVAPPVAVAEQGGRFIAWNSPYSSTMPYGSVYTYGGTWRCDWLREYFDAADASGGVSLETFIGVPARADRGSALNRGGGGQTDRAAREILLPFWLPLLPAAGGGEPYATVLELLSGFDGGAWPEENNGEDVADDYLLANAWVYEVIAQVFGPVFPPGTPRFSIAGIGQAGLPTGTPNQRFPAMVALLSDPDAAGLLSFDWLQGRDWNELVLAALDTALQRLPLAERPWGVGLRPTSALRPVGTGLPNPLATHPAGQSPSLIALVELSPCGPVRADSSVNFGVSGHVYNVDGEPLFGPHTQDQLDLWVGLGAKPAPRLFERTLACLERGREREWKNQSRLAAREVWAVGRETREVWAMGVS